LWILQEERLAGTSHNQDECRTKPRDQNKRNQTSQWNLPALQQSADNTEEQYQGKDKECDWHDAFITDALISVETHPKTEGWWSDSAASRHMTYTRKGLTDIRAYKAQIFTGNGPTMFTHKATATVAGQILEDVLVVPNLPHNLVSRPSYKIME
jgi:hypothetical protein